MPWQLDRKHLCLASGWLVAGLLLTLGCTRDPAVTSLAEVCPCAADGMIVVPGNQGWVDTGVNVQPGEAVTVLAHGTIGIGKPRRNSLDQPSEVGPAGTFFFRDDVADEQFPLPSAAQGPAPCYCLMGRIGGGPPFFVGSRKSWIAQEAGTLMLAVNDYEPADNTGQFTVEVTKPGAIQPIGFEKTIPRHMRPGRPEPGCSVVVMYLDGLRPDVVREMAAMGHLPNIQKHFLDRGVWLSHAFTAFPSDTSTSNATMWTGCFSDRHGLKGQVRFSRRSLHSESYLEPLGPNRSARLLAPQGIDALVQNAHVASVKLVRGADAANRWRQANTTNVAPIYERLRAHGDDWATSTLPLMTEVPPLLWTRSLVHRLPYLQAQNAWEYLDDANTHYAIRHLLSRRSPVTIIWLPETDSVSHKRGRGQFGMARRTIAEADLKIGQVVRELESQGRLQQTYLMLVSDHGHHGGRKTYLSHFDLANGFLYKPRELSRQGEWVGGGLGLSVRQHRFWNRHRGDSSREFVFVDGDSDGAARIFLPRGHYRSNRWFGPSRPADLLAYRIAEKLPPLNLVRALTAATALDADGNVQHPIDFVLMKLTDDSILISTLDRGQAVIHRKQDARGRWVYKYTPVENVAPAPSGNVTFREALAAENDPLDLLHHLPRRMLAYYHDERKWLRITDGTRYPDSVVTLTRHMLWQEGLQYREAEYAPDLVVTARPSWYFGHRSSPGTAHGYLLRDCMRASWFISGPNIRRGARIDDPCRLVDLTPTILEMVGISVEAKEIDGTPLRTIYEPIQTAHDVVAHPVYFSGVDLDAWQPLDYTPLPPYEHLPLSINRPSSAFDLNNIAYNILSVSEWSPLRIFDDVLFPLSRRQGPVTQFVEHVDERVRHSGADWAAEGAQALDIPDVALGDYSLTSLGNLKRVDGAVDWVQQRSLNLDRRVARRVDRKYLPGTRLVHSSVDHVQRGFWELYRFAQRVIVQVLDETILNGIEDATDRAINAGRSLPSEIIVEDQETSAGRNRASASLTTAVQHELSSSVNTR